MSAIAGRVLILPKGDYDASVRYEFLDLVNHNSSSWLAKKASTGIEPSDENSDFWQKFGSSVTPDGVTIVIDENGVISSVGGTAEKVTYENESVADVTNVKEALDVIFDGTQSVGDSARLGGKALNDIVLQEAKQVYVSPSGNDENGDGTQENPWQTIQKAVNECPVTADNNSMYSIYLSNGVYEEVVDVRGKVIRLYATNTENADITILGSLISNYNSTVEVRTPLIVDATNEAYVHGVASINGGNLIVLSPITIKNAKTVGLIINGNSRFFSNKKITITDCNTGYKVENASIAYVSDIEIKNCTTGISSGSCGISSYGSASFSNVTTQHITEKGGRIYTGAQTKIGEY